MPKNRPTSYLEGYQQALEDFAIAQLLTQLQNYSDADFDAAQMNLTQTELESLAAISIRDLTANLDGKAICRPHALAFAGYLNAIRHSSTDISPNLFHPACRKLSVALPEAFPFVNPPRLLYGDKLRWIPDGDKTDWGIAIGRFYSFAPHLCNWTWCYLIWLDCLSPSYAKTVADTAWEDDLERMEEAA
ncbi:hypothetical protein [Microseira wollei]|nr:hypothetical protein [Microseira wollei]